MELGVESPMPLFFAYGRLGHATTDNRRLTSCFCVLFGYTEGTFCYHFLGRSDLVRQHESKILGEPPIVR